MAAVERRPPQADDQPPHPPGVADQLDDQPRDTVGPLGERRRQARQQPFAGGDQRLGRRYTAGNAADFRTYTYRDSFSVTRAPNSQYWWVACAETDTTCRSDARLWTRAVSGQDASVDPQDRSPIAVASSD